MIISPKYKFIFIKTRKTAGTSLELYLSKFCGPNAVITPVYPKEKRHFPQNYRGLFNPFLDKELKNYNFSYSPFKYLLRGQKYFNHIPALYIKSRLAKDIWDNYYKFCFERNPYDKTISHYRMLKQRRNGELSLEQYFEEGFFCYNYPQYMNKNQNKVIVDRVAKYENLNSELSDILKKLKVPFNGELNIHAKRSTKPSNYREILSDKHVEIISERFKKEIDLLGYKY